MKKTFLWFTACLSVIIINSCSKKSHPVSLEKTVEAKPAKKTAVKTAIPKVIIVNDKYAKRSLDGRYYYDLQGHRYWRNNRDGKYYLFNKSMFNDKDFQSHDL